MTSSTDCCVTTTHSPSRSRAGECVWVSLHRRESGRMPKPSANPFGLPPASFSSHPSSHVFKGLKGGWWQPSTFIHTLIFLHKLQSHCFSRTSPGHNISYGSKLRKHLNQKTVGREGKWKLLSFTVLMVKQKPYKYDDFFFLIPRSIHLMWKSLMWRSLEDICNIMDTKELSLRGFFLFMVPGIYLKASLSWKIWHTDFSIHDGAFY